MVPSTSILEEDEAQYLNNYILLWVAIAAVDFIHIGDKFDTLTDDEEDDDHDKNPRHTGLLYNLS